MDLIAIILSGLALLAAMTVFVLLIREKKRNEKQRADGLAEKAKEYEEKLRFQAEMLQELEALKALTQRLEQGIVPDFEEAKAAAKAVNDFNRGLSNIMGFDPMESLRREREQSLYGRGDD